MASEVAPSDSSHLHGAESTPSHDVIMTNGDHPAVEQDRNAGAFGDNALLSTPAEAAFATSSVPTSNIQTSEASLPEPQPIEHVAPGIQSVADFIPKDVPTSHPTPPPDDPIASVDSHIGTAMSSANDINRPESTSSDASLVRPREDDGDHDGPIAKRSRLEEVVTQDAIMTDVPAAEPSELASAPAAEYAPVEPVVAEPPAAEPPAPEPSVTEAVVTGLVAREPPTADVPVVEPTATEPPAEDMLEEDAPMEDSPVEDTPVEDALAEDEDAPEEFAPAVFAPVEAAPVEAPPADAIPADTTPADATSAAATPADITPAAEPAAVEALVADASIAEAKPDLPLSAQISESQPSIPLDTAEEKVDTSTLPPVKTEDAPQPTNAPPQPSYSQDPLTPFQAKVLQEKLKNLKKTKSSAAFLNPVDPVALNIPTYPDIIKHPMDLNTMETKLKGGEYKSVQDFADDFYLIVNNTRTFNGPNHAVTVHGNNMEAYFRKMMESVPRADETVVPKAQKRQSPSAQKPPAPVAPRRESRSANASAATARNAPSTGETFALQPDGTPQIRRDSSINRPTRTIKPPANRELTYAKPKRKEHQLELRFCDHVLSQIRGPAFATVNQVFQEPVDPVALNIPHYRQVIKHPMDLSTMSQKLKSGQYGKASEFKKDFDLIIENCLQFNPPGNAVRDLAISFKRQFEALWSTRQKWEASQKAASQRAASDDESAEEEDDDEEDAPEDQSDTIRALQKQLADLQSTIAGLNKQNKPSKKSSKASTKPSTKKSGSTSTVPKQKQSAAKPKTTKKPKQVTYEEKQEISDAVTKMSVAQIEELTKIITNNCSKYADQEEMELEIDDLPSHVQVMLLEFVRRQFGNPKRARAVSPDDLAAMDDDDFEPAERGGRRAGNKRKKHKPMGKKEQQDTINNIQKQLAQFQNPVTSGSESPTNSSLAVANQNADTSGDESDESEEE